MGLGNWALEIGPWKLGLGKCSLGIWSTCKSVPLLFAPLGSVPLGNPSPLEKRCLAKLVPCRKTLGKTFLGIFTLGNKCKSHSPSIRPTAPLDLLFQNRKKVEKVHSNMM